MVEGWIQIYTIFSFILRRGRRPRLKPDAPDARSPRCPQVETWGYTNEVRLRGLNIRCDRLACRRHTAIDYRRGILSGIAFIEVDNARFIYAD